MKRFDQVNVIPFIDIMLVLLAIVLTTATFVSQGLISVDLPNSSQAKPESSEKQRIEISITAEQAIFLLEQPVSIEELEVGLKVYTDPVMLILRVDEVSQFGVFVQVLDLLKQFPQHQVAIQTKRK